MILKYLFIESCIIMFISLFCNWRKYKLPQITGIISWLIAVITFILLLHKG